MRQHGTDGLAGGGGGGGPVCCAPLSASRSPLVLASLLPGDILNPDFTVLPKPLCTPATATAGVGGGSTPCCADEAASQCLPRVDATRLSIKNLKQITCEKCVPHTVVDGFRVRKGKLRKQPWRKPRPLPACHSFSLQERSSMLSNRRGMEARILCLRRGVCPHYTGRSPCSNGRTTKHQMSFF